MTGVAGRLAAIDARPGLVLLGWSFLSLMLCGTALLSQTSRAVAQSSAEAASDRQRIERLADAGRLWGYIKFAHPALASRDIDWDQALIRALPAIRAARTAEDYAAAINSMLAALNDPWTRAAVAPSPDEVGSKGSSAPPPTAISTAVRTVDSVLVIDVIGLARLSAAGDAAAVAALNAADSKLTAERATAKGIVLDLRIPPDGDAFLAFSIDSRLRSLVGRLLNRSLVLGTLRSRQHYGYPSQDGSQAGGYSSLLVTRAPGVIVGQSRSATVAPIVILGNEPALLAFAEVAAGLKAAGLARVVEETSGKHRLHANVTLVENVEVQVAKSEVVAPDGQPGLGPDLRVEQDAKDDRALEAAVRLALSPPLKTGAVAPPRVTLQPALDKAYPEMALPDADHRLLALFRLWSVARYFFPYLDLTDRQWADTLVEFLPRFEVADTVLAYQTAVIEMATRLQDTHVRVGNATAVEEHLGLFAPPFLVSQVEGQTVVRHVHDNSAGTIQVGDVILAVDGVDIAERRKARERLIAASTPQAMSQLLDRMVLRGPKGSTARLRVRDRVGNEREVAVVRLRPYNQAAWLPALRMTPAAYGMLPSGFGYIDLQRLAYADADVALDAVMGAPAIILDMRGYPNGTAWAIAPRLVKAPPSRPIVAARFRPPFWDAETMPADPKAPSPFQLTFDQTLADTIKPRYQGKVVMLIDAWAISQAEHTCLFVAAATDVTFIGSPTNGANGDVTTMVLPGNLVVRFTGQEVRFPDGRQLQRTGLQPHIAVQPSIAGVRAGRDEVLEVAIEHLRKLKL